MTDLMTQSCGATTGGWIELEGTPVAGTLWLETAQGSAEQTSEQTAWQTWHHRAGLQLRLQRCHNGSQLLTRSCTQSANHQSGPFICTSAHPSILLPSIHPIPPLTIPSHPIHPSTHQSTSITYNNNIIVSPHGHLDFQFQVNPSAASRHARLQKQAVAGMYFEMGACCP